MANLGRNGTYSTDGPECPKCGFTFTPDESHYYDENAYTSDECPQCQTKFSVEVHHSVSWSCTLPDATPKQPE